MNGSDFENQWEKVFNTFFFLKDRTYPCTSRTLAMVSSILWTLLSVALFLLWDKVHLDNIPIKVIIFIVILFVLSYTIRYTFCKKFGITLLGKINIEIYAQYIINNFDRFMHYESERKLLKYALNRLKQENAISFEKCVFDFLNSIANEFPKKYFIEELLPLCTEEDDEIRIIQNIIVPLITNAITPLNFFITQNICYWYFSRGVNDTQIKIYFKLLDTIKEDIFLRHQILFYLSDLIHKNPCCHEIICDLQNENLIKIDPNIKYRVDMYCKAENSIKEQLNEHYTQKDERIELSNIRNNSLEDIPQ